MAKLVVAYGKRGTVYSEESDDWPAELERREEMESVFEEIASVFEEIEYSMPKEISDSAFDVTIPVPSTNDVKGVLRGPVDWCVDYKRFGDCGAPELLAVDDFMTAYWALVQEEHSEWQALRHD